MLAFCFNLAVVRIDFIVVCIFKSLKQKYDFLLIVYLKVCVRAVIKGEFIQLLF